MMPGNSIPFFFAPLLADLVKIFVQKVLNVNIHEEIRLANMERFILKRVGRSHNL